MPGRTLVYPPTHNKPLVTHAADASGALTDPKVLGPAVIMQGLLAARPAAGLSGRLYLATDVNSGTFYRDTGVAWVQVGASSGSAAAPLVSTLVNGGFEIWQRGAGAFNVTGAYAADRWQLSIAGTDTLSVAREAVVKSTNSRYSAACTFVLGTGAGLTKLRQVLAVTTDDFYGLLGQTAALQLAVRANAANAVRAFIETDGTGGLVTRSSFHTGAAAFENLAASVVVPADATFIRVGLEFAASVTAYADNATLVIGSTPADYLPLHPADEWERCQRYYETHGLLESGNLANRLQAAAGGQLQKWYPYVTKKALTPTATKVGTFQVLNSGQPAVWGGINFFRIDVTPVAAGDSYYVGNTDDDGFTFEANP